MYFNQWVSFGLCLFFINICICILFLLFSQSLCHLPTSLSSFSYCIYNQNLQVKFFPLCTWCVFFSTLPLIANFLSFYVGTTVCFFIFEWYERCLLVVLSMVTMKFSKKIIKLSFFQKIKTSLQDRIFIHPMYPSFNFLFPLCFLVIKIISKYKSRFC